MDTKDICSYRLALNYAIEPEAPKAQAPSPTCPFIKINYVKEHADRSRRTLINPDSHRGRNARLPVDNHSSTLPKEAMLHR
jgi:hypothetical protein